MSQPVDPMLEAPCSCPKQKTVNPAGLVIADGADSLKPQFANLVEDLVSAVGDALLGEIAAALVEEVSDRLLQDLPWRLYEEVREQFDELASTTASDLAGQIAHEVEDRLADILCNQIAEG